MSRLRPYAGEFALCLLGLLMLLMGLGQIPGLHDDEAWIIHTAAQMEQGARPLSGMNQYTGALHVYLLWPLMETFGYGVEVLRAAAAVCGALCMLLCMLLYRALYGGGRAAWVGMLLVSSPAAVAFFRFGVEITTVVPLLLLGALLLLTRAAAGEAVDTTSHHPRSSSAVSVASRINLQAVAAGLLMGLAAYTHVIALCAPLAAALALAAVTRGRGLRHRAAWQAALGFVVGFAPRLAQLPSMGAAWTTSRLADSSPGRLLQDVLWSPALLRGLWDGELVYQRFAGGSLMPVVPYASAALAVLALWRGVLHLTRRAPLRRAEGWILLFALLYLLLLLLVSPALSLRYFSLLLLLLPLVLVALAEPMMDRGGRSRLLVQLILCAVVLLNGLYLAGNYFFAFSRSGGAPAMFSLGQRLTETSNHFVRTDLLYDQLVSRDVGLVMGTHFIVGPLRVHDRQQARLRFDEFQPGELVPVASPGSWPQRTALVFYNGLMIRRGQTHDLRPRRVIHSRGRRFLKDPLFTQNFLVFINDEQ